VPPPRSRASRFRHASTSPTTEGRKKDA
jgi:hypothetical protein